jgi:hypothetical protein
MLALGCLLYEDGTVLERVEAGGPAGRGVIAGAGEVPHNQIAGLQVRTPQIRTPDTVILLREAAEEDEMGAPEVGTAQVSVVEVGIPYASGFEIRRAQVGIG